MLVGGALYECGSMITKILELITGKDNLERIAYREDLAQLNAYLQTRRLWIPRRPKRFLDATNFTQEDLLEMIRQEAEELSTDEFEPWILEIDGKNKLPAFSSQKKMEAFSREVSQQIGKVFSLGCDQFLLEDIVKGLDIDVIGLNWFSRKSWDIEIGTMKRKYGA